MQTSLCEFEFYEEEGMVLAVPFGHAGATEGHDLKDAVYMASDLLRMYALEDVAKGRDLFWGPLGNKPEHGGIVIAVSVCVSLAEVPSVTAAEAAKRLSVTTARVAQLCKAGELDSWRVGATRMVSIDSIELRLALQKRAGRPKVAEERASKAFQPTPA